MRPHQIAAQLYTLRAFLKTPEDIRATLVKVKDIGYTAVQVSGMGPIPEAELKALCAELGLTICATHEPSLTILNETEVVIARLQALGCAYTAYPHPKDVDLGDAAQVRKLAADLERAAQAMQAAGLGLAYHNHANEFTRIAGSTALEILFEEAPTLLGEIDTHWVAAGGQDPAEWCARLSGRMPIVHLKDYAVTAKGERRFAAIGDGNLDWDSIIHELEEGRCWWYIIEQDDCYGEDPFACLKRSRDFLVARYC